MGMNIKSSADLIAVSKQKQADASTAKTLDTLIYFNESSILSTIDNREGNATEKTGHAEATDVDVGDRELNGTLAVDKATPDALAWAFAMAFNNHSQSTPGGATNSRLHLMELDAYGDEPAYFTAAHRKGGQVIPAAMHRYVGCGINTLDLNLARGEYMGMSLGILGIGQENRSVRYETDSVNFTAGPYTVTLTYNTEGSDEAGVTCWADLDDDGIFETELTVTDVTGTTVTFADPSSSGTHNVRTSHVVFSGEISYYGNPSWYDAVEALSVADEFKVKAGNLRITIGPAYSEPAGVPTMTGGQVALCEVESMTYSLNWNGQVGRCWRQGAYGSDNATQVELRDPVQTIAVNRRVRDWLFRQKFYDNEAFGIKIDAQGPADSIEAGFNYFFEMFIPRAKFLEKPFQVSDGKWVEAGNILVLKDATNLWPTCVARVQNEVNDYLAP